MIDDSPPPLDPNRIADLLAAAAEIVVAEFHGLGEAGCQWRPAAGEWCANEVLGHIAEAERRGFAGRIRTLLAEDDPAFLGWDQPAVAAARGDCAKPSSALLEEFLPLRAESVTLVRGLSPADLARNGLHAKVGRVSIATIAAEWVHHDRNHIRQILAIGQSWAWPSMANNRKFSHPSAWGE
jgi:DinB superfamily